MILDLRPSYPWSPETGIEIADCDPGPDGDFLTGDMRRIASADGSCDAVFIFGVLHHIPEWKGVLKEVYRVLKNGGSLFLEEPRFRFSWDELESAMRETGFAVKGSGRFFFGRFHGYLAVK